MQNKLVLIDGNSILYRAFYALPLLNNNKGVHTNAVFGFTTMLMKVLEDEKPTHMLIAFDAGKTTFRHKTYSEYKGGRKKTPAELSEQFPVIKEVLDAFKIKHYELKQYEADDIIGTLSRLGDEEKMDVTVISGDKDLLQLVSENVTVKMTKKGISQVDAYTPETLMEKMEVRPDQIIHLKGLMGDNSDNLPGVRGVGEKTALKLLKKFETVEGVYEHIDEVTGKKLLENLGNGHDDAFMTKDIATIERHAPIEVGLKDAIYEAFPEQDVYQIFKSLGFNSLLKQISGDDCTEVAALSEIEFEILEKVESHHFTGDDTLFAEILTDNYHLGSIEGFALVNDSGKYFIPTEVAISSEVFKSWAEDNTKKKTVFDMKKVIVALAKRDIHLRGIIFDFVLASYIVNPTEKNHDIPAIAQHMGETNILFDEEIYGKGAKMAIPEQEKFAEHLVRKASMMEFLKTDMLERLGENNQLSLLKELEMPLADILAKVEMTGFKVNVDELKQMGEDLKGRLDRIEKEIHDLAGETFNINSPKQLGPVLFERLELPVIKKTKTGYSTAADVLEKLEDKHPIIPKLLLFRQLKKLHSTYIEGLLKVVYKDTSKIHTRFNQALTQTGRLSSVDPNLQNIPVRLEEGRKIRKAFIPSHDDWVIFSADYSQVELRVLAHISGDEKLIESFRTDRDIHNQTAMDVFHVAEEDITSDMRRQAKAVNFGIVYGISDYGLSQSLGVSRKEAQVFIDKYFESFPGVKDYMENIVKEAKLNGYVSTIMERRRYLPDITSRNFNRRSFAERTAMNTPIQGSAADIIKKAMIDLYEKLQQEGLKTTLLSQVHDELIMEVPPEELETVKKIVPDIMEHTLELAVPLKVDYSYGKDWFEAK